MAIGVLEVVVHSGVDGSEYLCFVAVADEVFSLEFKDDGGVGDGVDVDGWEL